MVILKSWAYIVVTSPFLHLPQNASPMDLSHRLKQFKAVVRRPSLSDRIKASVNRSRTQRATRFEGNRRPSSPAPMADSQLLDYIADVHSISFTVVYEEVYFMMTCLAQGPLTAVGIQFVDTVFDPQLCAFDDVQRDTLLADHSWLLQSLSHALTAEAKDGDNVPHSLRAAWAVRSMASTAMCAERLWAHDIVTVLFTIVTGNLPDVAASLYLPSFVQCLCMAPNPERVATFVPALIILCTRSDFHDPNLLPEVLMCLSRLVSEVCDNSPGMLAQFLEWGLLHVVSGACTGESLSFLPDVATSALFVLSEMSMLGFPGIGETLCAQGVLDLLWRCTGSPHMAKAQVFWVLSNILDGCLPAVDLLLGMPSFFCLVLASVSPHATDEESCFALQCIRMCVPEPHKCHGAQNCAAAQALVQKFVKLGAMEVLVQYLLAREHDPYELEVQFTCQAVRQVFSLVPETMHVYQPLLATLFPSA